MSHYTTSSDNFLWTFRNNLSDPYSEAKNCSEDGTDMLSRNVRKKLPLLAE